MRILARLAPLALVALCVASARAQVKPETVLDGLNNPSGVAIQPETGHVFVSDSGAGRVIRVVDGKAQDVIVGYAKDVYGKGPMYDIGPLGLVFLDKETLVVGGGDLLDGEEQLRVYTVPAATAKVAALNADQTKFAFKLPPEGEIKGEGNFYGLAATKTAVYVTSNGDDTKGWVAKADVNGTKVGPFARFIATKEVTEVDAPVAITISSRGELVVGQMGEINMPHDSLLTFYNAKNGKMLLNLQTGLYDITGLAYGPKSGLLYATDFAWMAEKEAGLFRLDRETKEGKEGLKSTKITVLDKPTAMVFGADGALYITVIGTAKEGDAKKPGQLLKIAPGL